MADEQTSFRRQPIPALARDNKDDWFQTMQVFLESKDLWHVIDLHASPVLTPASTESSAPTPLPDSSFPNKKPDAEARFTLLLCVDADNREIIGELASAGAMWRTLRAKYTDNLQVTNRSLHVKYVSYKKDPGKSIDSAILEISSMARKLVEYDLKLESLATRKNRFQILLQSLRTNTGPPSILWTHKRMSTSTSQLILSGRKRQRCRSRSLPTGQRTNLAGHLYGRRTRNQLFERANPDYTEKSHYPMTRYRCASSVTHRVTQLANAPRQGSSNDGYEPSPSPSCRTRTLGARTNSKTKERANPPRSRVTGHTPPRADPSVFGWP